MGGGGGHKSYHHREKLPGKSPITPSYNTQRGHCKRFFRDKYVVQLTRRYQIVLQHDFHATLSYPMHGPYGAVERSSERVATAGRVYNVELLIPFTSFVGLRY